MPADQGKFYGGSGLDNGRRWYERPTAEQREADRMAIIEEAHLAGLHRPGRRGCPWCAAQMMVPPERFVVDADRDGGSLSLLCPRDECSESFIGADVPNGSPTLGELYRQAAEHRCSDKPRPAAGPREINVYVMCEGCGGEVTAHGLHVDGGTTRCPTYGAPLIDGTGVTGTMIDVPWKPARFGFVQCEIPTGVAGGEHAPESPGSDGLGYGRCSGCGETWPCPAVQGK